MQEQYTVLERDGVFDGLHFTNVTCASHTGIRVLVRRRVQPLQQALTDEQNLTAWLLLAKARQGGE